MWFRLYTDILTSRKVLTLEPELFKAWVLCLALTKESGGLLPPIVDIAFQLRISEAEAQRLTEELVKCGLLDITDEGMTPHNWDNRQFLSDDDPTAAVRARRYRDRTRCVTRDATGVITDASRPSEAETEAETEPEPESEQSRGGSGENPSPAASRAKRATARRPVCDEEFFDECQQNPAYAALDVRTVYHKMVAWCANKGKQPTRSRLLNWLSREEKPMTAPAKKPTGNAHVGANRPSPTQAPANVDAEMMEIIEGYIELDDWVHIGQERDLIMARGGPKAEWEIRVVAYFDAHKDEPAGPERMARLNASIQKLTKR